MYPNLELEMFRQKISTRKLAQICGISESAMRNKIKGKNEPKLQEVKMISKTLGCTWEYLFAREGEPQTDRDTA